MKNYQELKNGMVGDTVTLSDFQSCVEFKSDSVDFTISGVRKYTDPEDRFTIIAYELEGPNEDTPFLLVIKQVNETHSIFVYYLDTDGDVDGDPDNPYSLLFDENLENLLDRIEVTVYYDDSEKDVNWDVLKQTHGVKYIDANDNEGTCTLAEYSTEDENNSNNLCLIDWRGPSYDGEVELWYGCSIKDQEVKVTSTSSNQR